MKKRNRLVIITYIFIIIAVLAPAGRVNARNKNPAKLGRKDFVYTFRGKKENFIKQSESDESYHWFCRKVLDVKNTKFPKGKIRTSRKVTIGSTESYVKKQYGQAKKVKVKNNEKYYKFIKYGFLNADTSAWKSYMEYAYKKGGDKYRVRFCFDQKNKVTAIVYIKNLEKFYNYPNKEMEPALEIKTPDGKKVTAETINGKKVYVIPEGTKISLKKDSSKPKCGYIMAWIQLWDQSGKDVSQYRPEPELYRPLEAGREFDVGELAESSCGISPGKSRKCLYYTVTISTADEDISSKYAPKVYYFKFQ